MLGFPSAFYSTYIPRESENRESNPQISLVQFSSRIYFTDGASASFLLEYRLILLSRRHLVNILSSQRLHVRFMQTTQFSPQSRVTSHVLSDTRLPNSVLNLLGSFSRKPHRFGKVLLVKRFLSMTAYHLTWLTESPDIRLPSVSGFYHSFQSPGSRVSISVRYLYFASKGFQPFCIETVKVSVVANVILRYCLLHYPRNNIPISLR